MSKRSLGLWWCKIIDFAACIVVLFLFLAISMYLNVQPASEDTFEEPSDMADDQTYTEAKLLNNSPIMDELRYIPHSTVHTWKERNYLILFGIPSVDVDGWRRRRYLQRTTCWQFPGVATRSNNFTGAMLVLYVLARHPSHGYNYSTALEKEADEYHDIITLPMNEGRSSTNKRIGTHDNWGMEAEVGMSKKTYYWFETALKLFPHVNFISKADDDIFLRVPQFLTDLRSLPRNGIYWGGFFPAKIRRNNSILKYEFALGPCYTLSRNLVAHIVSNKDIRRLVQLPYTVDREAEFISRRMQHEDVMVGLVLRTTRYASVHYVMEKKCSFHDVHQGIRVNKVKESSIMIHRVREKEYKQLMDRFGSHNGSQPRYLNRNSRRRYSFSCL
ncbi:putative UDP-Gal or UDP-GlcNAc-dependent glycosyltransferase [Trypanosoma theileri]|uniref:Hexosyltransferase n=1 Tax=Trypanosoma theileri TaxID=67003 RepID=A0A1X0NK38_9TRYP|nr:putative UDP-Gal or UDP-GlcNAc-dependent glycosyltransferase [Trypanosoma theileri]ORC84823.1 putative UDP-Gal or UDP-GlcNAc-dependent glycosyltransferase [Trypanosoma theileri]